MMSNRWFWAFGAMTLAASLAACSKSSETTETSPGAVAAAPSGERVVEISVASEGYKPSVVEAKEGENLVLRFTRSAKGECLAQVVFPDLKITKDLPMGTPVDVRIPAVKAGRIPFQCGMGMAKGVIHVAAK